ncbi:hypothetical protein AXA44_45240 [Rhodococcus sp. SC4]|nr:hypothetical protein AXA44_45240 [Rhodococcus sp. SC4]
MFGESPEDGEVVDVREGISRCPVREVDLPQVGVDAHLDGIPEKMGLILSASGEFLHHRVSITVVRSILWSLAYRTSGPTLPDA